MADAGGAKDQGLKIDKVKAVEQFGRALELARSDGALPEEWLDRTTRVGQAVSKTFTAMLGTALLAKATNDHVNALALKASVHKGYSARSLAKDVLVPRCSAAGIDLGNQGPEPLNNQPFFGKALISMDMQVKDNARVDFAYLVEGLEKADYLRGDNAVRALAAFLRARIAATAKREKLTVGKSGLDLPGLLGELDKFVSGDPEGGKVGQAAVAAILDVVFPGVRTKRINDPSVKWPGDVGIFVEDALILAAEVKQRPFSEAEIPMFAQWLHKAGVHRGLLVAFCTNGFPFDVEAACKTAYSTYDVDLATSSAPSALLRQALRFAGHDLPRTLQEFPQRFMVRMEAIEVSVERRRAWSSVVGSV